MNQPMVRHVATVADQEAVLDLLVAQFQEHEIDLPADRLRQAVAAMVENPALGFFVVASEARQMVGLAAVALTWTLEHAGQSAWLDEVYVRPEWRGQGIGTALVREAVRLAKERGCAAVDLEVDHEHRRAEGLYAREGFQRLPRSRWVRRLDEE